MHPGGAESVDVGSVEMGPDQPDLVAAVKQRRTEGGTHTPCTKDSHDRQPQRLQPGAPLRKYQITRATR